MQFVKLYSSITESTIWDEDDPTRICWITMLAMSDRRGRVMASVPGLAHRARISVEACARALAKFAAPDEHSRTKEHDGRRIEEIDGGWMLLTYEKHRARQNEEACKESKRVYAEKRRLRGDKPIKAMTDEEWTAEMVKAFPGIDVRAELARSKAWLMTNGRGRRFTRRFANAWLNRTAERRRELGGVEAASRVSGRDLDEWAASQRAKLDAQEARQ